MKQWWKNLNESQRWNCEVNGRGKESEKYNCRPRSRNVTRRNWMSTMTLKLAVNCTYTPQTFEIVIVIRQQQTQCITMNHLKLKYLWMLLFTVWLFLSLGFFERRMRRSEIENVNAKWWQLNGFCRCTGFSSCCFMVN